MPIDTVFKNADDRVALTWVKDLKLEKKQDTNEVTVVGQPLLKINGNNEVEINFGNTPDNKKNRFISDNNITINEVNGAACSSTKYDKVGSFADKNGTELGVVVNEMTFFPRKVDPDVKEIEIDAPDIQNKSYYEMLNSDEEAKNEDKERERKAVTKMLLTKEAFCQDLKQGTYKNLVQIANEERESLMLSAISDRPLEKEKVERSLKILILEQIVRAERLINDGKPGKLENDIGSPDDLYGAIDKIKVNLDKISYPKLDVNVPENIAQEKYKYEVKKFIASDAIQTEIKNYLKGSFDRNKNLSLDEKTKLIKKIENSMNKSYEMDRLENLWERLEDADPFYIESSKPFKELKELMKNALIG